MFYQITIHLGKVSLQNSLKFIYISKFIMSTSPLPSSSSPQINKTTNQSKYSLFYSTFGQNISLYQNISIYLCLVTCILDLFRITSFITPYANNYGL